MKHNKKNNSKLKAIAACLLICLTVSACGQNSVGDNTAYTEDAIGADAQEKEVNEAVNADIEIPDKDAADKESTGADSADENVTESTSADGQQEIKEDQTPTRRIEVVPANKASIFKREDEGGRRITVEEMQYFTEFIQTGHNYGFLLSVYDTPADVNLFEVCYNGLGILSQSGISEEEREAYKKTVPWGEIYTDFSRITTAELNDFLLEKTGLSYEQMSHPLGGWTYLPEYDAYYSDCGDTNYERFSCVGGYVVDEKFYILRMRYGTIDFSEYDYDELDDYLNSYRGSNYKLDYELVLEKCGDTYQFRSNRLILEDRLIEEQSFTVNLSPIGEVTLVSYEPDEEVKEKKLYTDVTFYLIKDGMEMRRLDGTGTPRYETKDTFNKIEAVAFADYDEDGITDIIMILDYDYVSGPNAAETHSEVRIYKGEYIEYSYGDYFYKQRYQQELSESITAEISEPTIRSVLDYLAIIS